MEYVEAYALRARFVLSRDGKILWPHSVKFHPMLQQVTRSRGWNITKWVNDNVGNEIELGMVIPMIKSRILQLSKKQREWDIDVCVSTMKYLHECTEIITDIQIWLMIIYQRRVSVMTGVFPSRRLIRLRVRWHVRCFWYIWNCQRVDKRKSEKFRGDLKVVRRVPEHQSLNK
jgi:hypothetical protein